ncbi:MAG: hypothetical protein KAV87_27255 [Desulfobacteraceae bacterium]|nr:hypothetical protein [Desulfobacteraceae bacterium]
MNISMHIERLILDGISIPHHQRPLLQAAVEQELTRLLVADGLSSSIVTGGTISNVTGNTIRLTTERTPTQLGQQIAQVVYGGLNR